MRQIRQCGYGFHRLFLQYRKYAIGPPLRAMNRQAKPDNTKLQSMVSWLTDASVWSGAVLWAGVIVAGAAIWSARLSNRESTRKEEELEKYKKAAELRIEEVKKSAKAADARAEEAKKTAEGFKLSIATANASAEVARRDAEVAKLEQEKLKAQLSWRTIPVADADRMLPILSATPSSVVLAYTANDPESLSLTIQLSMVFAKAGWETIAQSRTYNDQLLMGLFINGSGPEAESVRRAFNSVGAAFSSESVPTPPYAMNVRIPEPPVLVMIGCKQPPF